MSHDELRNVCSACYLYLCLLYIVLEAYNLSNPCMCLNIFVQLKWALIRVMCTLVIISVPNYEKTLESCFKSSKCMLLLLVILFIWNMEVWPLPLQVLGHISLNFNFRFAIIVHNRKILPDMQISILY